MTNQEAQSLYFDVLDRYLRNELGAEEFCTEFISVWRRDRDRAYAQKQS